MINIEITQPEIEIEAHNLDCKIVSIKAEIAEEYYDDDKLELLIEYAMKLGEAYAQRDFNKKLEGCVVVPKDQIEVWWQDAEEPENFASTIESIPALGENLDDKEIMEIDEHHTIHLPSKRIYGTWFEKDGERSFLTGSLEECRAMVEAARGGNE